MDENKEYNEELELEIIYKMGELKGMIMILDSVIEERLPLRIKSRYIGMHSYLKKMINGNNFNKTIRHMAEKSLNEKKDKNGE